MVPSDALERKLSAIMYADVVGFSRLTGEDEEGTYRVLRDRLARITELIEGQGGRVVKYIGDAIMAEFSSAVAAVSCGEEIQLYLAESNEGLPEDRHIVFRIGINLGEVIVDGDDLFGDGVNVAARLEGLSDPGGVCVSASIHQQVEEKINCAFEDMGDQEVKNIAQPVRVYRVVTGAPAASRTGRRGRQKSRKGAFVALAGVIVLIAGVAAWWFAGAPGVQPDTVAPATNTRPSIAVLPFQNISGDKEQEYFADGITDDLINDLSKVSGLLVIARNSVFTYKNKPVKLMKVADELGVRYVVEGSVRRAADRVRVNVQLAEAESGEQLWADRFDRPIRDVFAVQDEVVGQIVSALAVQLSDREKRSVAAGRGTTNLAAYEAFLKGREERSKFTFEAFNTAKAHFSEAVKLDPGFARAHSELANHYYEAWRIWNENRDDSLSMATGVAERAIALDPDLPRPHLLLAEILQFKGEPEEARKQAQKAFGIGLSDADSLASFGGFLRLDGRPKEAIKVLQQAIRLDPLHPPWYLGWLGHAYFLDGQYDRAIATLKLGIRRTPDFIVFHLYLAASYAASGRLEEAKASAARVLEINPNFTLTAYGAYLPHSQQVNREKDLAAMRQAGLPD